jgi:hypothetical protein
MHRGLVDRSIDEKLKERIGILGGHARGHLRSRLFVGQRLEPERPIEDAGEDLDPVARPQCLRSAQPIGGAGVPVAGQRLDRDGRDIGGIDRRHCSVAERGPDRVAGGELIAPLQHVGHERVGLQERPVQAGLADHPLGHDVVAGDRIVQVTAGHGARGLQHDPAHAGVPCGGQQRVEVVVAGQQMDRSDAVELSDERLRPTEIADDRINSRGQPISALRTADQPFDRMAAARQLAGDLTADVAGRARDEKHVLRTESVCLREPAAQPRTIDSTLVPSGSRTNAP